jgi:tetratricopeptide (TPR) repeat protein
MRILLIQTAPGLEEYVVGLSLSRVPGAAKFVAREKELYNMHQLLHSQNGRSVVVLHGLGGIGKTQLAVAYTHRHKTEYSAIFWVDANSDDSIGLSFVEIARQILNHYPCTGVLASMDLEGDSSRTVKAVISWFILSKNTRWLLIYDNYDNPRLPGHVEPDAVDLCRYMPQSDHGSILVTTRSSEVALGLRIYVKKLSDIQEGLAILSYTSGREGIEDGELFTISSLFLSLNKTDTTAVALVEELDGLPLALSTAGAYLEQVTTSILEYQSMYKTSWLELQRLSPQVSSYEDRSLYTTWQLSLDQIKRRDNSAAKLLKLWAYFDRQDVWYELLQCGSQCGRPCEWLQQVTGNRMSFDHTMRLLCSYGLVEPESSKHKAAGAIGYSVHSCVHAWTISVINKEWDEELAGLALSCVASMVPNKNTEEWWLTQSRLLRHVARCDSLVVNRSLDTARMEWALHSLGNLYVDQNKLKKAEMMYERALQGKEEALGTTHTSTLDTVNKLGKLYMNQGRLKEAEAMYMRALQGKEEALGPKHTSTLDTVNNLGKLYMNQGKLKEAEVMYTRVLQGYEEALGTDLVDSYIPALNTICDMGDLYAQLDQKQKAMEMYSRALAGFAAIHGRSSGTCQHINSRLKALNISTGNKEHQSDAEAGHRLE